MMRRIYTLFILLAVTTVAFSKEVPKLTGRINDYAHLLNPSETHQLENYLSEVEVASASQIVLLTINSLEGDNLEDFSMRVAETWKIGQKGLNNGAILLVSKQDRKIRIEVGYGLEPYLTDAKSDYIIRNAIVPQFKRGDYVAGISQGLQYMGGIATKEFEISDAELQKYNRKKPARNKGGLPIGAIIFVIIIILGNIGRRGSGGFLTGMLFGSMMSSGRSSGGFGGGGGFGGFSGGGGGFGGGGASGNW